MSQSFDLIVIGGGPAGANAAIEAARGGLETLLIDEAPSAGGQVHRAPLAGLRGAGLDHDMAEGQALRDALAASAVTCQFSHRVWMIERGFGVFSIGPDGPSEARSESLVLATGALERNLPIPGWTLPGVIGLAAATLLLKAQAILPGRRVVVAGTGPLLPLVAALIVKGGGSVAAVVDATPAVDWIGRVPSLMSRPDLLAKGAAWVARLVANGVPIFRGHALVRIDGVDAVERVTLVPIESGGAQRASAQPLEIECDAVCYGFGLLPSTEATRLLRAEHDFVPSLGGWVPRTDKHQRTSVEKLYAAGDGAGILGAAAAPYRGRLAALAAQYDLGRLNEDAWHAASSPLLRRLEKASTFGRSMSALASIRPKMLDLITPETVVCRCEGVTRKALEEAIALGTVTMNDLKAATRCGMGPCGGRVCSDTAAALVTAATGRSRQFVGEATGRPPLRPLPFGPIAGDFNYDDLPIPAPAPL